MNIRIGNDIKLKFTIRGPQGADEVNIKQMRCYLVNTSFESKNKKSCEINKRFPMDPFPQFYTPSKYTLHGCGKFQYNVNPHYTKCGYDVFGMGYKEAHMWPWYNGFGVCPDHFVDHFSCTESPHRVSGPVFLAPSTIEEAKNTAAVYFPACEQRLCGPYKLIVVLVVYEFGWGKNNLHTYTIDYGTVFNLVDNEIGMSGNIVIDVDNDTIDGSEIESIKFDSDEIYTESLSEIALGEKDRNGNVYDLHVILKNGSFVKYRYDMWQDEKLTFTSNNADVIVTSEGKLIINKNARGQVTITASNHDGTVTAQMVIRIGSCYGQYIGFADTEQAKYLNFDATDNMGRKLFTSVDEIVGNHHVVNYNNGYYLWIISCEPLKDVNSSLFDVPLADVQIKDNHQYCYHCPNPIIATNFDITIEN